MAIIKGRNAVASALYNDALVNTDGQLHVVATDLETLLSSLATKLDTLDTNTDGIETLLTAIDGHVDGLESALSTLQTSIYALEYIAKQANFAQKTYDWSAATTGTTIWTPASGKRINICDITIGIATECTVKLYQSSTDSVNTRICQFHFATNGGTVINFRKPFALNTDNVIKLTTSHASSTPAGSVTISGFEV